MSCQDVNIYGSLIFVMYFFFFLLCVIVFSYGYYIDVLFLLSLQVFILRKCGVMYPLGVQWYPNIVFDFVQITMFILHWLLLNGCALYQ